MANGPSKYGPGSDATKTWPHFAFKQVMNFSNVPPRSPGNAHRTRILA